MLARIACFAKQERAGRLSALMRRSVWGLSANLLNPGRLLAHAHIHPVEVPEIVHGGDGQATGIFRPVVEGFLPVLVGEHAAVDQPVDLAFRATGLQLEHGRHVGARALEDFAFADAVDFQCALLAGMGQAGRVPGRGQGFFPDCRFQPGFQYGWPARALHAALRAAEAV